MDLFLARQKRVLFEEINMLPPGSLLEIGIGNGRYLKHYQAHSVVGIDNSEGMLKVAERNKTERVRLLLMNGESLQFENQSFDYVVLSHVIAVVGNADLLLDEIYRVLKSGGKILILNHFTPDNWLSIVDRTFKPFSSFFHFKSVFYIEDLPAIRKFKIIKVISVGRLSYFKLLIYEKP